MDSRSVPGNVAYHHASQVLAYERLMGFSKQACVGELGKGAAERRLAGQRPAGLKAQQAAQHSVNV